MVIPPAPTKLQNILLVSTSSFFQDRATIFVFDVLVFVRVFVFEVIIFRGYSFSWGLRSFVSTPHLTPCANLRNNLLSAKVT